MKIEQFELDSHYMAFVRQWWGKRSKVKLSNSILSNHGFCALDGMQPVAVMFFFPVIGSKVAMVGWPIADPGNAKRKEALPLIVAEIESYAKRMGYELLFSYPGNDAAQNLFESFGYSVGDEHCVNYIKRL